MEENIVRGGDGGVSTYGGEGFFLGWFPLASSYFDSDLNKSIDEDLSNCLMRRKIILPAV